MSEYAAAIGDMNPIYHPKPPKAEGEKPDYRKIEPKARQQNDQSKRRPQSRGNTNIFGGVKPCSNHPEEESKASICY